MVVLVWPDLDTISAQLRHSFLCPAVIDWITAVIPCAHPEPIRGGRVLSVSKDGVIEWEMVKAQSVAGPSTCGSAAFRQDRLS